MSEGNFGARGLEEFLKVFFLLHFYVGFEPSFARPEPKLVIKKKKTFKNSSGASWMELVKYFSYFEKNVQEVALGEKS